MNADTLDDASIWRRVSPRPKKPQCWRALIVLPLGIPSYRHRGREDPFYKNDLDLSLPLVPDTLEEAMRERNLPLPSRPKPTLEANVICR
jgi:hypothetical protein